MNKNNLPVLMILACSLSLLAMDNIDNTSDAVETGTVKLTHEDLQIHIINKDFESFNKTLSLLKKQQIRGTKKAKKTRAANASASNAALITQEIAGDLLSLVQNTKTDARNQILKDNTIKLVSSIGWIAPMIIVDVQQNQAPIAVISTIMGGVSLKNFYDIFTSTRKYMADNNLKNIQQLLEAELQMLSGQSSSSSQPAVANAADTHSNAVTQKPASGAAQ